MTTSEEFQFAVMEAEQLREQVRQLETENKRLRETLAWYEEHVFNARRVSPEGETARKVLDDDGGKRARMALTEVRNDST